LDAAEHWRMMSSQVSFFDKYNWNDQAKEDEMGRALSMLGEEIHFGGKYVRSESSWHTCTQVEYNIKIDLTEMGWGNRKWVH
jgi:hypothetical protein